MLKDTAMKERKENSSIRIFWDCLCVCYLLLFLNMYEYVYASETSISFTTAPVEVQKLIQELYKNKCEISVLEEETEKKHPGTQICISKLQHLREDYNGPRLEYWMKLQREQLGIDSEERVLPVSEFDTYKHYTSLIRMCEYFQSLDELKKKMLKCYLEQIPDTDSTKKEIGIYDLTFLENPQKVNDYFETKKNEFEKLASDYRAKQAQIYHEKIWYQARVDGYAEFEIALHDTVIKQWIPQELKNAQKKRLEIVARLDRSYPGWEAYNNEWERISRDKKLTVEGFASDAGSIATEYIANIEDGISSQSVVPITDLKNDKNKVEVNKEPNQESVTNNVREEINMHSNHIQTSNYKLYKLMYFVPVLLVGVVIGVCWKSKFKNNIHRKGNQ
jgi:hypothetical protein